MTALPIHPDRNGAPGAIDESDPRLHRYRVQFRGGPDGWFDGADLIEQADKAELVVKHLDGDVRGTRECGTLQDPASCPRDRTGGAQWWSRSRSGRV